MADSHGAFDGIVDSLSSTPTETPQSRLSRGQATNARGESPAVEAANYHLDQPVDRRQPFAKSAADDGGYSFLASPNERGPTTREALLAADQSGVEGSVTMKPRSIEVQRGDGKAKRGTGAIMSSEDVGLALRPILIQRQADVDDMGQAIDPVGFQAKTFASDGTVHGMSRINASQSVTVEPQAPVEIKAGAEEAPAPVVMQAPAKGMAPRTAADVERDGHTGGTTPGSTSEAWQPPQPQGRAPVTNPRRQRVIFSPPEGGKIRTNVEHVVIGNGLIILMYDANADTSYEPPRAGADAPIGLQIGDKQFRCIYNDWSAEDDGTLYLVMVILPDVPAS